MKQEFSIKWKASRQPRKQRKYSTNAPLHLKRKLLSINLSDELRKKYGKRSIVVKKGDKVKIMRGKFKNKNGKIIGVDIKNLKLKIEGIIIKKQDGSKVNVKIHPSNLQIIELNLDDRKRLKNAKKEEKAESMQETKPSTSQGQSKKSSVKETKLAEEKK